MIWLKKVGWNALAILFLVIGYFPWMLIFEIWFFKGFPMSIPIWVIPYLIGSIIWACIFMYQIDEKINPHIKELQKATTDQSTT